jgi:hypothetical protein
MRELTPHRRRCLGGFVAGASIGIVGTRQRRWRYFGFMLGDLLFASARICDSIVSMVNRNFINARTPFLMQ